jgi:hypothetical protein
MVSGSEDLAILVKRLIRKSTNEELNNAALDYLKLHNLLGSPLRGYDEQ